MNNNSSVDYDFLQKITDIIERNLSNEQFGVSELAAEIGMSRSNLLRRVKKNTDKSVSLFIREIRLKNALTILSESSLTVSEVSYKVGFGSTSYFIKCFHEHYGYSPGETNKSSNEDEKETDIIVPISKKPRVLLWVLVVFFIAVISLFIVYSITKKTQNVHEKSIAVLPFINDSGDSSNVYIINGLMESVLNKLQKIKDLKVISRTSVEKYRNSSKSIPEIANQLGVRYIIEGSGQKIGDQILLNIQLIEANTDNHLWAEQYNRKVNDIFILQNEVATNIAKEIQVIITPEEEKRINKTPTDNLVAYDYFLKGLDQLYKGDYDNLNKALINFKKAIEHDNNFARAYADVAITYYMLDAGQNEQKYSAEINTYSDNALLLDPQLPQSLISKALFYMYSAEYDLALPYLEKALEYNPNSVVAINTLSDFYTKYSPNTEKYLEYALMGIDLDIASHDSITASFIYLHLSNAFIQSGFQEEAEYYIHKSLVYNPKNLYSQYVKAFIQFARDNKLKKLKKQLLETLSKDTTRLDIIQEVGKINYYLRDYEDAYHYYGKFIAITEAYNLDIYKAEDAKIGYVLSEVGLKEKSEEYFEDYLDYAMNDKSIYSNLSLAVYYSYINDTGKALEHMKIFSQQENYHYWTILFLNIDPLVDNIKEMPEYLRLYEKIDTKFWRKHNSIRQSLREKGLI